MPQPALSEEGGRGTRNSEARKNSMTDVNRWATEAAEVHYGGLLRFATWMTRNPDDAEDAVQEALKSLISSGFGNYDGVRPLSAFLLECVKNAVLARWRKTACGSEASLDESRDEGSILETVAATGFGNTEAEVKNLDRREALAKGVKGLSESDRKLFELVFIQEKELKDVARSLSCEYAALKVRVSRLRHKLRKALEGKVDLT